MPEHKKHKNTKQKPLKYRPSYAKKTEHSIIVIPPKFTINQIEKLHLHPSIPMHIQTQFKH